MRCCQRTPGRGEPGSEAIECEREDAGAHLLAEPTALEVATEPRAGVHRPGDSEAIGVDRLRTDRRPVELDHEIERADEAAEEAEEKATRAAARYADAQEALDAVRPL